MQIRLLDHGLVFPDPETSHESGIVAVGGDLSPERLELAYRSGIFPWYNKDEPIIWWSPDPRFILYPDKLVLRRSLAKTIRKQQFEIRFDTAFARVIDHCAKSPRPGQDGTWITREMRAAYIQCHRLGLAHSVETWLDGVLVGGLYGVALGPFFFGESMFHLVSDASKVALVALVARYRQAPFIDCQVHNPFFASMGAEHIPRRQYLDVLARHVGEPNHWHAEAARYRDPDHQPWLSLVSS